eukprot:3793690-Rhodomonas_salina.1
MPLSLAHSTSLHPLANIACFDPCQTLNWAVAQVEAFSGEPMPAGFSKQRTKVHRDGDWHRAVHIWLYTSQGDLVLQQ